MSAVLKNSAVARDRRARAPFRDSFDIPNGAHASRRIAEAGPRRRHPGDLHTTGTDRKGTPKPDSFEVAFERTSENPDVPKPYRVDAKMQCDLPAG